ncbi:hypothetical protein [Nocardia mexicana]|uniref:hypothetical protein n=1 Tax=Nocardia mexicana TaxID=279262 RepID=UPI0008332CB6|nr:hypothetical protein [Nocardia mexicana]
MSNSSVGARVLAVLGDPRQGGLPATARDDAVTAALSVWLVGGLLLDAWAHASVPEPEPFSTPWQAVFYTGFLALAGWTLLLVRRGVRGGLRGAAAVPLGYRAALPALIGAVLSVAGDLVWHIAFHGTAEVVDVQFGPAHLGLAASVFVLVTTPVRSAMSRADIGAAPPLRLLWPALLACGAAAALVVLFLGYGNAAAYSAVRIVEVLSQPGGPQVRALAAAVVISTAVLLLPLLFAARRWRLPFGAALLTMLPAVAMSGAETDGRNVSILVAFAVAAVGVDLLALCLDPAADRPAAYWGFAGAAALFTWGLYVGVAAAAAGSMPPVVELWTGLPIAAALVGWLLGVLMLPARGIGAR